MIDAINLLFSQQFLLRALFVGTLISLCCALLGVSLVLKRFSMIGDGLSHVGFGALAIACAANIAPLYFSLPIVLASAFLLLKMNENGKMKSDAAIAIVSAGALAVGVMVTSMTTGMNIDIYNYMFGSILTMTKSDVAVSSVLSAAVIAVFTVFYHEIFAVTFDESFAKASGSKTSLFNMLIAGLTAVTIVVGMRMMGALLISSLIIFPTVTSMRVCKSYRKVVFTSAVISVVCFLIGLIISISFDAPTGASVVCVNIFALAVFSLIGFISSIPQGSKIAKAKKVLISLVALVSIAIIGLLLTVAPSNSYEKNKISVVTTGFAPYDFAKQIAGERCDVTMLLSPGEESHTFEPTPSDIMKIEDSDVFIYGGGESDEWVNDILDSIDNKKTEIVKMMDVTEIKKEDVFDYMEHEEDEEEYDEHVWTSPVKSIEIVRAICDALCRKDKVNEELYRANTSNYIEKLKELDNGFKELSKRADGKYFVVGDRFPFKYLADEYGFSYYAAFPGCSAQTEASPSTIAFLIDKVKKENIPAVFKVDLSTGNVASSISESTNAKVLTLYSCHVVSADDFAAGETYISLMKRNIEALSKAF